MAQIQGDHRFFQCSQQCTDAVWDTTKKIDELYDYLEEHDTIVIPDESRYQEQYQKSSDDIEKHLHDKHVLFLELGVGRMTPMFIQKSFWALTNNLPGAFDVMVNRNY